MLSSRQLDTTFAALADPTRRAILARLATAEASVSELAEPFDMSQPAISKHLKVLERAGLITTGRDAQRRPRRMEAAPLVEAAAWIERYRKIWEGNYQRLDALLSELQGTAVGRSTTEQRTGARGERTASKPRGRAPAAGKARKASARKATTRRSGGKGR